MARILHLSIATSAVASLLLLGVFGYEVIALSAAGVTGLLALPLLAPYARVRNPG